MKSTFYTPSENEKNRISNNLRFSFLVLGAQVFVPAFAAAGCTNRVACVAVHAYLDVEEPGFGFRELCHGMNFMSYYKRRRSF